MFFARSAGRLGETFTFSDSNTVSYRVSQRLHLRRRWYELNATESVLDVDLAIRGVETTHVSSGAGAITSPKTLT